MVPAHRVMPTSKAAEDEGSKLAEDVVAITQEEGGKGRASGPLSGDEVTGRIGPTWIPSHRRGVNNPKWQNKVERQLLSGPR